MVGDVGQVQRLLHGGVAAADNADLLAAIEKAVAGCAGGNAFALESLLGGEAEVLRRGARSDDQCVTGVGRLVALQGERPLRKVRRVDVVMDHLDAELFGMPAHAFHQVGTLQVVGIAGPVLDLRGGHELTALLEAGHHHRTEICAGSVDRGRVTGGARAEDQQAAVLGFAHV